MPVIGGVIIGVGLVLVVSGVTTPIFVGINPRDPFTLIVVSLLLFAAAMAASWLPARRAASLDPVMSLRGE